MDARQLDRLRPWLLATLEPICEADPTVLSDYILALLRHESSQAELRQLCLSQLDDFLDHQTQSFVDQLFAFINAPLLPPVAGDESRKRKLELERDQSHEPSRASAKLPRTETHHQAQSPPQPFHALPTAPAAMRRDQGPSHAREQRHPARPGPPQWALPDEQARPGELCKDYHFRGFCARGDACPFVHDTPSPPQAGHQPVMPQAWRPPAPAFVPPFPFPPSGFPPFFSASQPRQGPPPPHRPQNATVPRFSEPYLPPRAFAPRAGPAASAHRPDTRQQSTTTLVVENAPRDALSVQNVRQFFDKFGPVTEVAIDVPALRAVVTFANPDHARAALGSPEAVFGNRFVRLFRQRLDDAHQPAPLPVPQQAAERPPRVQPGTDPVPRHAHAHPHPERTPPIDDLVLDVHRQERAARASRLLDNAAEQKELMRSLDAVPTPDAKARSAVMASLRKLAAEAATLSTSVSMPETKASDATRLSERQAQLARLRQEASELGIDTQPGSEHYASRGHAARGRGRGYSRGGRGTFTRTFRLDNRTTKLLLTNIPAADSVAPLREYFERFGQIISLVPTGTALDCVIEFKERGPAEQALSQGSVIAGVGQIKLEWHTAPSPAPKPSSSTALSATFTSPTPPLASDAPSLATGDKAPLPSNGDSLVASPGRVAQGEEDEHERSWNR